MYRRRSTAFGRLWRTRTVEHSRMKRDVQQPFRDADHAGRAGLLPRDPASERLELALATGHMGTWEWEISTGCVTWSAALERIHGLPEGGFPGTFEA